MALQRKTTFTLIEILVAVAIMGISLVIILTILGNTRAQLLRAEERWAREHLLTQATEFYLLAGPEETLPPELLPEGFSADCELEEARELPENAIQPIGNTILKVYRVQLYGTADELLGERTVEKLINKDLDP